VDPISIILSALSLASKAVEPISGEMIKDGYAGLKNLIIRKFEGASRVESTVNDFVADPETYQKPAAKVLSDAGVDRDQEVLEAATALLRHAEALQPGITGGVVGQINAQGGRIVAIGGDLSGTIHMGDTVAGESPGSRA
jgi:hypothetical protein